MRAEAAHSLLAARHSAAVHVPSSARTSIGVAKTPTVRAGHCADRSKSGWRHRSDCSMAAPMATGSTPHDAMSDRPATIEAPLDITSSIRTTLRFLKSGSMRGSA